MVSNIAVISAHSYYRKEAILKFEQDIKTIKDNSGFSINVPEGAERVEFTACEDGKTCIRATGEKGDIVTIVKG